MWCVNPLTKKSTRKCSLLLYDGRQAIYVWICRHDVTLAKRHIVAHEYACSRCAAVSCNIYILYRPRHSHTHTHTEIFHPQINYLHIYYLGSLYCVCVYIYQMLCFRSVWNASSCFNWENQPGKVYICVFVCENRAVQFGS